MSDLHRAGVAQGLRDQDAGHFGRRARRFEIDRLHESFRPLALVGLGEAGHRAAHRRDGSGLVVTVQSAEPRRRHQERVRPRHLLVQHAHRRVEQFDAHTKSFVPGRRIHAAEASFVVQRGQPVDSGHRSGRHPFCKTAGQRLRIRRAVDPEDFRTHRLQPLLQRIADAGLIRHQDHAASGTESHASGFAEIERRTHPWGWHAPWDAVRRFEAGRNPRRGLCCPARRLHLSYGRRLRRGRPVLRELNDVRQRREIAQLEIRIARDVEGRAHRGEHLRLFHGVDAEVGFQVEIQVQHVHRVAGLLGDNRQHLVLDGVAGGAAWPAAATGGGGATARSGRRSCANRITCARVGKSRSLRFGSRGML